MLDLLLELFSEEIPARLQSGAAADLKRLMTEGLDAAGCGFAEAAAYATPRRLALSVSDLTEWSADRAEEKKGPRVGAPDAAIAGFLKSAGLSAIEQAEIRSDKKGDVYIAVLKREGRPTTEILAAVVPEIVRKFPWPKSMRWGAGRLRWVRPLHSILCVLDGKPVTFNIDGLTSGNETRGHRFMAPASFAVENFQDYVSRLREAKVVLDSDERQSIILKSARTIAAAVGAELIEDEGLLAENAGLTEWPVVLSGRFDESFLDMPPEVLSTAMKTHQKCFSLRDQASGKLINRFILVANLEAKDGGEAITAGNERVIRARLADAKFFWDQDRKVPLEQRVHQLEAITFHARLGTQYERVRRIMALARELAPRVGAKADDAERAAILAKADLTTGMVGEFPELQGLMGRYYALDQREYSNVADAVAMHYKPVGPSDVVPTEPIAIALALADKLDTLIGFWAIDEKPTGSKDPYALRRAALGVIRIILENEVRLRLGDLLGAHFERYREQRGESFGKGFDGASFDAFFADRLKVYLRGRGARHDLIDAVFGLNERDDLLSTVRRVEALGRFLGTEDGEHLLAGVKRAFNILRIEERRDGASYDQAADEAAFAQAEERALAEAIRSVGAEAQTAVAQEDFEGAMQAMARLRAPVDAFFDAVTVNADDAKLRANRLRLLSQIRAATLTVADFSRIEG